MAELSCNIFLSSLPFSRMARQPYKGVDNCDQLYNVQLVIQLLRFCGYFVYDKEVSVDQSVFSVQRPCTSGNICS